MPTESPITTIEETLNYPLEIVLEQYTESGHWIASVKGLKGAITFADTKEQCMIQIPDAIKAILATKERQRQADRTAYLQKQANKAKPLSLDVSDIIDVEKQSKAIALLNEVGPYLQELENLGLKIHFDDRGYDIFKKAPTVIVDQGIATKDYGKTNR